jgi:hypothetical protein
LNAYHSFSFGSWYNADRVQFGARVLMTIRLLQEWVLVHIHMTMEIITIPLEGDLALKQHGKYRNHQKWRCAGHERWN